VTLTRYRLLERRGSWRAQATTVWFLVWRDIATTNYGVYTSNDEHAYIDEQYAREALETFKRNEQQRRAPWRRVRV
jgi:hypothetical protein